MKYPATKKPLDELVKNVLEANASPGVKRRDARITELERSHGKTKCYACGFRFEDDPGNLGEDPDCVYTQHVEAFALLNGKGDEDVCRK